MSQLKYYNYKNLLCFLQYRYISYDNETMTLSSIYNLLVQNNLHWHTSLNKRSIT